MLDDQTRLRTNLPEIAAKIVDGEAILINLNSGVYYSMSGSGPFIWGLLDRGASIAEIVDAVAEHYRVPEDGVLDDIRRLANELIDERLAVVGEPVTPGDGVSLEASSRDDAPTSFDPPILVRYDDMAEIFALDPPLPELPAMPADAQR